VYLRRLRIFFNHIQILSMSETIYIHCNIFAEKSLSNSKWAFNKIFELLQFQKERLEKEEISTTTLRNFDSSISCCQIINREDDLFYHRYKHYTHRLKIIKTNPHRNSENLGKV
jgi:polyphosphate kinase